MVAETFFIACCGTSGTTALSPGKQTLMVSCGTQGMVQSHASPSQESGNITLNAIPCKTHADVQPKFMQNFQVRRDKRRMLFTLEMGCR
jgi:hypothetical protein